MAAAVLDLGICRRRVETVVLGSRPLNPRQKPAPNLPRFSTELFKYQQALLLLGSPAQAENALTVVVSRRS